MAGLVRGRTGPKGASKLTAVLAARIVELEAAGLTLAKIAARTGVSTATVRVALGRVAPPTAPAVELAAACEDAMSDDCEQWAQNAGWAEDLAERDGTDPMDATHATEVEVAELPELVVLVVLAPPVARTAELVAARFGEWVQAPVLITEGAQLPHVGLLLALPALEMTGLLAIAAETFGPMRKGFYGLRVTLLMGCSWRCFISAGPRA